MKFTDQQWATLSEWVDQGLELTGQAREDWLERLPESCPVPRSVLRDLFSLSEANQGTGSFLNPLPNLFPNGGSVEHEHASNLFAGRIVGAYHLIRELGVGGMGAVWLGERSDGTLKRPVAIKLPHASVYGRHFIERFHREREILAALTHPHIARLYDAGITAEGEPFLTLEYIEGTEFISYCDENRLGVRERLKLFLQVLSAVHYANSHLVIHRDLKPSNILVGSDGAVKLLDFGVAKLILDGEAPGTELTQKAGHALTPRYASPEQLTGEPISTASDVYSLGVVLFELLTGERPYRTKVDSRASLEEAILAGEIVRPSQAARSVEKSRARTATVKKLTATLKGDLDTIILKALSRQPDQRYATADAFSQDIQRYLDGQPVLAEAASAWYHWKKFAVRNRFSVGSVAAVVLALTVGLWFVLWEARKAHEQALVAESVLAFMEGIFRANSVSQPDPVKARQTTARELLDIGAMHLDAALKDVPAAKMRVLVTLADMYDDLDLWDKNVELGRKRVALARSLYGPYDPAVTDALLNLAECC
jgi:serine/threonine protein kinase